MRFITKKVIQNKAYYYLQYQNYFKSLGSTLPNNLKEELFSFFQGIGVDRYKKLPEEIKKEFPFGNLEKVEKLHYKYICLSNSELFQKDFSDFMNLFTVSFVFNSNRSEGSSTDKSDVNKIAASNIRAPKTKTQLEVLNSMMALKYAFNKNMPWNSKNIKAIHKLLLAGLDDKLIVGKWKNENNTAPGNQPTTDFAKVDTEMKKLFDWVNLQFKQRVYPPLLALKFYVKFESIHPFLDGNGRVGRILLNAILFKYRYMPIIFFTENHKTHTECIYQAREGRTKKLHKHFIEQAIKTYKEWLTPQNET